MRVLGILSFGAALCISLSAHAQNLYPQDGYRSLYEDPRARHVGDIVTVLVVESSVAESAADTSESGDFDVDASVNYSSSSHGAGLNIGSGSSGMGKTARTGRLQAQVSARVDELLPNGNMLIRGAQTIRINGENQRISLEGYVRPVDIGADNAVLSTRMMNARIDYSGEGWVSRNQRPGLFRRFFQFLGF